MSLLQTFFVPYCTNLPHMFFYPVQLHFGQHYFCSHGLYNTLTDRCVLFLTRQVAMLRVELINQDKSNVFMPGLQGAGRGGWKGEKVVTVSRKNGWALLVVAAGTEGLHGRSGTNASLRRQRVLQVNGEKLKCPAFETPGCRWASLHRKKKIQWFYLIILVEFLFCIYLCLQRKGNLF